MRLEEFLSRLPAAPGRVRRCPAHDDRTASLSVTAGRDGRILVRCFAGCEAEDIVHALGLELRDLFPDDIAPRTYQRVRRNGGFETAPSPRHLLTAEIEAARRVRLERNAWDTPNIRSDDFNAAVSRVNALTGTRFTRVAPFEWEEPPHDADELWPLLFDRAKREIVARFNVPEVLTRESRFRVVCRARELQREIAARQSAAQA